MKHEYLETFRQSFGGSTETVRIFFAPGRVNLIGEHTDYNGGYVLPAALKYGIWAFARRREDGILRLKSMNFDREVTCDLDTLQFRKEDDWANYPKGVIQELRQSGAKMSGADILFYGNIPSGAGLSSSAAVELATALAMKGLNGLPFSMLELVRLCQRAENRFVGVNCGIMDQFAVGMGRENHALFLNCLTLEYAHVPLHLDGYRLVITNTNKRRGLAGSKYNERRRECERGLEMIRRFLPHVESLGALTPEQWSDVKDRIGDETIRRRVQHVVEENARVLRGKEVLEENRLEEFGELMIASHISLRDLYEVTGKELDVLFEAARRTEGCAGARMTGAGFGGCTVSLVKEEAVAEFKKRVEREYTEQTGLVPSFYVCDIGPGARELTKEDESWPFW